jgi:hypothetical protein
MAVRSALRATGPYTPRKIPGTHFCKRLSRLQGHSAAERIRSTEESNDLIDNRTRDFSACKENNEHLSQGLTVSKSGFESLTLQIHVGIVTDWANYL